MWGAQACLWGDRSHAEVTAALAHSASPCCRFVSRIFVVPDHPELLLSSSGVSATLSWAPLGSSVVTEQSHARGQELILCSQSWFGRQSSFFTGGRPLDGACFLQFRAGWAFLLLVAWTWVCVCVCRSGCAELEGLVQGVRSKGCYICHNIVIPFQTVGGGTLSESIGTWVWSPLLLTLLGIPMCFSLCKCLVIDVPVCLCTCVLLCVHTWPKYSLACDIMLPCVLCLFCSVWLPIFLSIKET